MLSVVGLSILLGCSLSQSQYVDYTTKFNYEEFPLKKYTGYTWQAYPFPNHNLPFQFSWCDVGGKSYCGPNWQQHEPSYCGTCYVHGTLSAVADRIKYANSKKSVPVPDVILSRQSFINCGHARGRLGNGCDGGEAFDVLEYMHRFGLPDETCQNYLAHDKRCTAEALCMNCMYESGDENPHCWAIPENQTTRYYVKEYGFVSGEVAIMNEIFQNGPVTCGMTTPDEFNYGYRGGVWIDRTNDTDVDHDVEVAGWGVENGVKYWLVRNSWGSYWGINGWFKVERGVNALHIEEACAAAVVDTHELDELLSGAKIGSMFGVIPRDQKPQVLPPHWQHMQDHRWTTTKADALRREREVIASIDQSQPGTILQEVGGAPALQLETLSTSVPSSSSLSASNSLMAFVFGVLVCVFLGVSLWAMVRLRDRAGYSAL